MATIFSPWDSVEVCSADGAAWHAARIVHAFSVLPRRYFVSYDASVNGSVNETVPAARVRPRLTPTPAPAPSASPRFLLYQLVDAFCGGGWRAGVVSKFYAAAGKEPRFVVCFPEEREELEFRPEELRPHLDWVDGKRVSTEEKKKTETLFSKGTPVEVASDSKKLPVAWYPAIIIEVIDKNVFVVKYETLRTEGDTSTKEIVASQYVRPYPRVSRSEKFDLLDEVEAFYNNGWWPGVVAMVITGSRYNIKFLHWEEEIEFGHSDLRLLYEWIDGQWVQASQGKSIKLQEFGRKTSVGHMQLLHASSTHNCEVPVLATPSSCNRNEALCKLPTNPTSEENENLDVPTFQSKLESPCKKSKKGETIEDDRRLLDSLVIPRGTNLSTEVNNELDASTPVIEVEPNFCIKALLEKCYFRSRLKKINVGERDFVVGKKRRKKSIPQKLTIIAPSLEGDPTRNQQDNEVLGEPPSESISPSHPTFGRSPRETSPLPFEKSSSMWNSIESMEVFSVMPQQPHFCPLNQYYEDFREGMAVGLMITFSNLVANICKLRITDSCFKFHERLKDLGQLEAHGFDVKRVRDRITELLRMKEDLEQVGVMRSELNATLVEKLKERNQLNAKIVLVGKFVMELEKSLSRIQELKSCITKHRIDSDTEVAKILADSMTVQNSLLSAEHDFVAILSADWQTL